MANKLKIYACSGVGDQQQAPASYWLDGTRSVSNTQAVNNLLSIINLLLSELQLQLTEEEILERYNQLDYYAVALRLAQRYYDSDERLAAAGNVLGYYCENGAFSCSSFDDLERSEHLEKTYQIIVQDIDINNTYSISPELTKWWAQNVVDLNRVGLTEQEQQAIEQATEGVGAVTGDLATYLNDAKSYFLYTFIPEAEIKSWPKAIQQKRKKQLEIYNYCLPIYKELGGSEDMMQRIIRSSIISTFKLTPEAVLRRIKDGKAAEPYSVSGVGDLTMAVATVVAAVISAVIAIITVVLECVAQVSVAKYAVPTDAELGIPEDEDFAQFTAQNNSKNLLIIGAAILGFLLLKKNKRKRK